MLCRLTRLHGVGDGDASSSVLALQWRLAAAWEQSVASLLGSADQRLSIRISECWEQGDPPASAKALDPIVLVLTLSVYELLLSTRSEHDYQPLIAQTPS